MTEPKTVRPRKPKAKPQYKILLIGGSQSTVEEQLNTLAADGWQIQVISISQISFDGVLLHGVAHK